MTYDEIIAALKSGKCDATVESFERAIEDEKRALFELPGGKWKKRDMGRAAREAAREFYADDITRQLTDPVQPSPSNMMGLRRFPVTWAVAEVLRTNKLVRIVERGRRVVTVEAKS